MRHRLQSACRIQRGSGWAEFAIVAALLTCLAAFLLPRLMEYQERAEKTLVDLTIRSLRTTLRWQVAQHMFHGRADDLADLVGANPVSWLEQPPAGYLGELAGEASGLGGGTWYFDTTARQLVYVPQRDAHLSVSDHRSSRLCWQVRRLKPPPANDVKGPVDALVFAEAMPYQWF
jgi:hypothetical protein